MEHPAGGNPSSRGQPATGGRDRMNKHHGRRRGRQEHPPAPGLPRQLMAEFWRRRPSGQGHGRDRVSLGFEVLAAGGPLPNQRLAVAFLFLPPPFPGDGIIATWRRAAPRPRAPPLPLAKNTVMVAGGATLLSPRPAGTSRAAKRAGKGGAGAPTGPWAASPKDGRGWPPWGWQRGWMRGP